MGFIRLARLPSESLHRRVGTGESFNSDDAFTKPERLMQGILYALSSEGLPLLVNTLDVAEQVRARLMGIHRQIAGGAEFVSPRFSGKGSRGEPLRGHMHAYILPVDRNMDGRIDHLSVICKTGFNASEQAALYRLTRLKGCGHQVQCVPISSGDLQKVCVSACRFVSATPFIPPRHYRRGRGEFSEWLKTELRRECRNHGVQDPIDIRIISSEHGTGLSLDWTQFRMSRKQDHRTMGYGFEIAFRELIDVPIAVGYGAHFGLGQFRPVE